MNEFLGCQGCLEKDTMVQMADESRKKISDVRLSEWVRTLQGSREVQNIFRGHEEKLIYLESSSGRSLLATADHPVQTEKGMKRAEDILSGDRLMTENGQYEELTALYLKDYMDTVYNLQLEGNERTFYANGFLVGDMDEQNAIMMKQRKMQSLEEEEQRLQEEIKRIRQELGL